MKTPLRILLVALLAAICVCHAHSHKKKHHSGKKTKRTLLQDEVNYDEFTKGVTPRRYKKTATKQE